MKLESNFVKDFEVKHISTTLQPLEAAIVDLLL